MDATDGEADEAQNERHRPLFQMRMAFGNRLMQERRRSAGASLRHYGLRKTPQRVGCAKADVQRPTPEHAGRKFVGSSGSSSQSMNYPHLMGTPKLG